MKILILSADTGGGHNHTAQAFKKTLLSHEPDAEIIIENALEYVSHFLNNVVVGGYYFFVKKAPRLYGVAYRLSDKKSPVSGIVDGVTKFYSKRLISLIEETKPDAVLSVHPFATNMAAYAKEIGKLNIPIVAIMTDYAPHRAYINEAVDKYVVSSDDMIKSVSDYGIPEENIVNLGIPIENKFYERIDRNAEMLKIGFDPNKTTALFMAGSFGVTKVLKIYENIAELDRDFQVIIITGNNERLYEKFEKYIAEQETPRKVLLLKFTTEVEKYMQMADMIITKPGGLTVTESLATGLPMVVFKAYPGQEEDNTDYLLKTGSAVKIDKTGDAGNVFLSLLESSDKLESMKKSAIEISHYHSADKIYEMLKDICNRQKGDLSEST